MTISAKPNIQSLIGLVKELSDSFDTKPCGIITSLKETFDSCISSKSLESPICNQLSNLLDDFVSQFMDNDTEKWCENDNFMKSVTKKIKATPCDTVKILSSQIDSCDKNEEWCEFLLEIKDRAGRAIDLDSVDVCKEKSFFFYIVERLLVMKSPCEIAVMIKEMNSAMTKKRSILAKEIHLTADEIVRNPSAQEFFENMTGNPDFWSMDMCQLTEPLETFIDKRVVNDKCNILKNIGDFQEDCQRNKFKKSNPLACKVMEMITSNELADLFHDTTGSKLFTINVCDELDAMIAHLRNLGRKPCEFLKSFKPFEKCKNDELYCRLMQNVTSMIRGSDGEGIGGIIESFSGDSITDFNPCEFMDYLKQIWTQIGQSPCLALQKIGDLGTASCAATDMPCKMVKKMVRFITNSDIAEGFEDIMGLKLWDVNICQEYETIKSFVLAVINRPCALFQHFKTQQKVLCPKGPASIICTGISFARDLIRKASQDSNDFDVFSYDFCSEQDYVTGIFKKLNSQVSDGTCVGYTKLSEFVDVCPATKPMLCKIAGGIFDCLGKDLTDFSDDDEEDFLQGICKTVLYMKYAGADMRGTAGDEICGPNGLIPEVKSLKSDKSTF